MLNTALTTQTYVFIYGFLFSMLATTLSYQQAELIDKINHCMMTSDRPWTSDDRNSDTDEKVAHSYFFRPAYVTAKLCGSRQRPHNGELGAGCCYRLRSGGGDGIPRLRIGEAGDSISQRLPRGGGGGTGAPGCEQPVVQDRLRLRSVQRVRMVQLDVRARRRCSRRHSSLLGASDPVELVEEGMRLEGGAVCQPDAAGDCPDTADADKVLVVRAERDEAALLQVLQEILVDAIQLCSAGLKMGRAVCIPLGQPATPPGRAHRGTHDIISACASRPNAEQLL